MVLADRALLACKSAPQIEAAGVKIATKTLVKLMITAAAVIFTGKPFKYIAQTILIMTKHKATLLPILVMTAVRTPKAIKKTIGLVFAKIGPSNPANQALMPVSCWVKALEIKRATAIKISISQENPAAALRISKSGLPLVWNMTINTHKIAIKPKTPILVLM